MQLLLASLDDRRDLALPVTSRNYGFHTQQAVEKLLKVLIAAHGTRYEFTHSLDTLIRHAERLGEAIPSSVWTVEHLTSFAGAWRYEAPPVLSADERERLAGILLELHTFVLSRLKALRPDVNWDDQMMPPSES